MTHRVDVIFQHRLIASYPIVRAKKGLIRMAQGYMLENQIIPAEIFEQLTYVICRE